MCAHSSLKHQFHENFLKSNTKGFYNQVASNVCFHFLNILLVEIDRSSKIYQKVLRQFIGRQFNWMTEKLCFQNEVNRVLKVVQMLAFTLAQKLSSDQNTQNCYNSKST